MLSLAGGLPTAASFPIDDLAAATARVIEDRSALQYSATDGLLALREWIATDASQAFDRDIAVEGQIVVTHGSQQALDLLSKVLIDPGDVVVSESPAYLGAVQSLELFQPRFEPIEGDHEGMRIDLLAERLEAGLRPKLVYVVANFHNPSGATLNLERRQHLARLADEYEFLIVEDDPYGAIRFRGEPLPPIARFTERVVYLSTFSKIVAPGFRVGWMIGPPEVMSWVARAKQAADLHTSTFAQRVLTEVVSQPGWLDEQKQRIVPIYREHCDALADALDDTFGDRLAFHRPEGGMFLWTEFTEIADTTELLAAALDEGVAFVPGNAFTIDQRPDNRARFSYATLGPDGLRAAVTRLATAADTV